MTRFVFIFLCALLCSCQVFRISDILDTAERQVVTAPDSALTTMRSVRRYALLVPENRARYSLIYSATLDKNYVDVAADSLIRYSADYYDMYGTPLQRMQSYYYLGRTQENGGEYQAALLSFLDAAQYTDRVDDNYLKGLLYSRMAEMYEQFYDYEKGYKYAELSCENFRLANIPKHQAYQLYKMGDLMNGVGRYKESIEILQEAIRVADSCGYKKLLTNCYLEMLYAYENSSQYPQALNLLEKIEKEYADSVLCRSLLYCSVAAVLHTYNGDVKKGKSFLETGWRLAKTANDSLYMKYYDARILYVNNKIADSYKVYSEALYKHNHILFNSRNSKDLVEDKYFEQKAKHQKRTYSILLVVLAVVAIFGVVYVYVKKKFEIRKKDNLINQYLIAVQNLHGKLRKISIDSLNEKFGTINRLCSTYYEYAYIPKQQEVIFREVSALIDEMRNDEGSFAQMEQDINQSFDNILVKLNAEVPSLSSQEYRLFCYLCVGFSNQAISVFMECESGAIATRKSRLKAKIVKANTPNLALFLTAFS